MYYCNDPYSIPAIVMSLSCLLGQVRSVIISLAVQMVIYLVVRIVIYLALPIVIYLVNGYILGCVIVQTSRWKRTAGSYIFGHV